MNALPRRELGLGLVAAGCVVLQIASLRILDVALWPQCAFLVVASGGLGFALGGVRVQRRGFARDAGEADATMAVASCLAALFGLAWSWAAPLTAAATGDLGQASGFLLLGALAVETALPSFCIGLVVAQAFAMLPHRAAVLHGVQLLGAAAGVGLAALLLARGTPAPLAVLLACFLLGLGGTVFAALRPQPLAVAAVGAVLPLLCLVAADGERAFPLRVPPGKAYAVAERAAAAAASGAASARHRGRLSLQGGGALEVETVLPPPLTEDRARVRVHGDDGPVEVPLDRLAPQPSPQRPSSGETSAKRAGPQAAAGSGESVANAFAAEPWAPWRRWTLRGRIDGFHLPHGEPPLGLTGLSARAAAEPDLGMPRQKVLCVDGDTPAAVLRWSGAPLFPPGTPVADAERARLRVLEFLPAGTVYHIKSASPKVLCLGARGGLDVLIAKYFGAARVTAVESSRELVDAVRTTFAGFAGHLYDPARTPDVEVHVADERLWLDRCDEQFDVVQLAAPPLSRAAMPAAAAFTASRLDTLQAFASALRRLGNEGVLTATRPYAPSLEVGDDGRRRIRARWSLRLLATARRALQDAGVPDPGSGTFLLRSGDACVILVKPSAFTRLEAKNLRDHCTRCGFEVLWSPWERTPQIRHDGELHDNPFQQFMEAPDAAAWLSAQPFDVAPSTDDRPFAGEVAQPAAVFRADHRTAGPTPGFSALAAVAVLFGVVLLLGVACVLVPLRRVSLTEVFVGARRVRGGILLYFGTLGTGLAAVHLVLQHELLRWLGDPGGALVVAAFTVSLFSAGGAFASPRLPLRRSWPLFGGVAVLAAALLLDRLAASAPALGGYTRVLVAVLALAPAAFALGVPFPNGVTALARSRPGLVPFAWTVHAWSGGLGVVLGAALALELGLLAAACVAAAVQALAVLALPLFDTGELDEEGARSPDPVWDDAEVEVDVEVEEPVA